MEIALFGEDEALTPQIPFEYTNLGVLAAAGLAQLYSRATIGLGFSLTNPSLVSLEMMACGLSCVELATDSMLATFGADGRPVSPPPTRSSLCSAVEQLLDDLAEGRDRLARSGHRVHTDSHVEEIGRRAGRVWVARRAREQGLTRCQVSVATKLTKVRCHRIPRSHPRKPVKRVRAWAACRYHGCPIAPRASLVDRRSPVARMGHRAARVSGAG